MNLRLTPSTAREEAQRVRTVARKRKFRASLPELRWRGSCSGSRHRQQNRAFSPASLLAATTQFAGRDPAKPPPPRSLVADAASFFL
ncbi:hypothetical protein MTO96_017469 [Rhipicephalus appendiculatus]